MDGNPSSDETQQHRRLSAPQHRRATDREGLASGQPAILIVAGAPEKLHALEAILRGDIEVITASSGRAALRTLVQRRFVVAVIDDMPDMTGSELAALIRGGESTRLLPIIIIGTPADGHASADDRALVDHVTAPVDLDVLRGRVQAFVGLEQQALRDRAAELEWRTAQLRRLASDLTLAERRARERLARTLHDDLQQVLFSARLKVDRVAAGDVRNEEIGAILQSAVADLDDAIQATRSLSVELSPPVLHDGRFADALRWLASWNERKYGLQVDLAVPDHVDIEQEAIRVLVFDSVRELLFNVVKHANVPRARLEVQSASDGDIRLLVEDDGSGFDASLAPGTAPARHDGLGLFGIRERIGLLGGRLDIHSAPRRGTRCVLVAPSRERRSGPATGRPAAPSTGDA